MWRACWVAIAALTAIGASQAALAADRVGETSALIASASQTPPAQPPADLKMADPIYRNATLETKADGALEVRFIDGSRLSLGSGSVATVDQFVYAGPDANGRGATGQQAIKLSKGLFRFISGTIPKENVKIETPTVTIGIRGTVIRTLVDNTGSTTVGVDQGLAFITLRQTGQSITLQPGTKITVGPGGTASQVTPGTVDGCD